MYQSFINYIAGQISPLPYLYVSRSIQTSLSIPPLVSCRPLVRHPSFDDDHFRSHQAAAIS